jgi:hypothetical protein
VSRVVVATGDVLGDRVAGPAIRAWKIAEVLSAAGHEVELVTVLDCDASSDRFTVRHVGEPELRTLERWCDVLVFQGALLQEHPFLRDSGKPLVVDIYDPFPPGAAGTGPGRGRAAAPGHRAQRRRRAGRPAAPG